MFRAHGRRASLVGPKARRKRVPGALGSLHYDGVILFLDGLILWLATHLAYVEFVTTEASKLATFVEPSKADRPAPIISFIARQRDLTEFVGVGLPGVQQIDLGATAERLSHLTRTVA